MKETRGQEEEEIREEEEVTPLSPSVECAYPLYEGRCSEGSICIELFSQQICHYCCKHKHLHYNMDVNGNFRGAFYCVKWCDHDIKSVYWWWNFHVYYSHEHATINKIWTIELDCKTLWRCVYLYFGEDCCRGYGWGLEGFHGSCCCCFHVHRGIYSAVHGRAGQSIMA